MTRKITMKFQEKIYTYPEVNDFYNENFATLEDDDSINLILIISEAEYAFVSRPGEFFKNNLSNELLSKFWGMNSNVNIPVADTDELSRVEERLSVETSPPETVEEGNDIYNDYITDFVREINGCTTLSSCSIYTQNEEIHGIELEVTYLKVLPGTILYDELRSGNVACTNVLGETEADVTFVSILAAGYQRSMR